MINVSQFRTLVVQPVLRKMAVWQPSMNTPSAENLLVGTAVQESHLTYLKQLGTGPALGVMQIEPATHDDVWINYLDYRKEAASMMLEFSVGSDHSADQLPWNLAYCVAMARMVFWRQPSAIPADASDLEALGQYWKAHYNTAGGAGTAQEWVSNYQKHVQGT